MLHFPRQLSPLPGEGALGSFFLHFVMLTCLFSYFHLQSNIQFSSLKTENTTKKNKAYWQRCLGSKDLKSAVKDGKVAQN